MQSWLSIKNKIIPSQKSKLIQTFNKIKNIFMQRVISCHGTIHANKTAVFLSTNAIRIYVFWRIFCFDNFVKQVMDYFVFKQIKSRENT